MRLLAALSLVAVFALAGCASDTGSDREASATVEPTTGATAQPTAEPTGSAAVEYATLEELRLALVSTGEPCDSLQVLAAGDDQYGICLPDNKWGVYVYPTAAALDAVVQQGDDSVEPGTFLVGTNWMIGLGGATSVEAAAPVQAALGGTLWKANEPFVR